MMKAYYNNERISIYSEYNIRQTLKDEQISDIDNLLGEINNIMHDYNAIKLIEVFNKYSNYNYSLYYDMPYFVKIERQQSNGTKFYIIVYKNAN